VEGAALRLLALIERLLTVVAAAGLTVTESYQKIGISRDSPPSSWYTTAFKMIRSTVTPCDIGNK
jgi:hypothetical protein